MKRNEIFLNKEIYDYSAIKAATQGYKQLARIQVDETRSYYVCGFSHCKYGITRTIREFCNYVIDIMNCKQGLA